MSGGIPAPPSPEDQQEQAARSFLKLVQDCDASITTLPQNDLDYLARARLAMSNGQRDPGTPSEQSAIYSGIRSRVVAAMNTVNSAFAPFPSDSVKTAYLGFLRADLARLDRKIAIFNNLPRPGDPVDQESFNDKVRQLNEQPVDASRCNQVIERACETLQVASFSVQPL